MQKINNWHKYVFRYSTCASRVNFIKPNCQNDRRIPWNQNERGSNRERNEDGKGNVKDYSISQSTIWIKFTERNSSYE